MLRGRFHKGVAEELVVRLRGKNRLPVVASLDNVLRLTGYDITSKASHLRSYC